jgi:hypothetical protein
MGQSGGSHAIRCSSGLGPRLDAGAPPARAPSAPPRPPPRPTGGPLPPHASPQYIEPAVQWGFIPAVIILGMYTTKPRPAIGQFFFVG